jgi:hypothetical protein
MTVLASSDNVLEISAHGAGLATLAAIVVIFGIVLAIAARH